LKQLLKARVMAAIDRLAPWLPLTRELIYLGMVNEAIRSLKLNTPPLYPTASAANYSLLYVLLRAASDTPGARMLDIGAGQSSLVLNALAEQDAQLQVTTLEGDETWARLIQQKVRHPVIHAPLTRRDVQGRAAAAFELAKIPQNTFDIVVVDAPHGEKRHSRRGVLEVLDRVLDNEFLVIFDDAGRVGEQDTIRAFLSQRHSLGVRLVFGSKAQILAFTPKYRHAAYY